MNIKLTGALALVAAALAAATPALANTSARAHEHRTYFVCEGAASHISTAAGRSDRPMLHATSPQAINNDDWPNNLPSS